MDSQTYVGYVSKDQFIQELIKTDSRLCRDLSTFQKHYCSNVKVTNASPCIICGKKTWTKCQICGIKVHVFPVRGNAKGKPCFIEAHDPSRFGLCLPDSKLIGVNPKEWQPPSKHKLDQNKIINNQYLLEWNAEQSQVGINDCPDEPIQEDPTEAEVNEETTGNETNPIKITQETNETIDINDNEEQDTNEESIDQDMKDYAKYYI